MSASYLSRATAIFVVDCCQFGPSWILRLKMELMAWADLVDGTYDIINYMKHFQTVCITPQPCHSHFVVDCYQFCHNWI